MPIRFRCPHCQQLLGIAHRKAGTNVKCPTCANSVLVPHADENVAAPLVAEEPISPPPPPPPPVPAAADPFDRDDFDVILRRDQAPSGMRNAGAVRTPPPATRPRPPEAAPWQEPAAAPPAGIVLSPGLATLLTVVVILLLAASFIGGLLVGRFAL